jgi:signal transduction histidine kinase
VTAAPDLALAPSVQKQALNIVGEALVNVHRHAQARRVSVCIERAADRDEVRLVVEDDGRGFDLDSAGGEGHFGLTIMHARAVRCGGQLTVESAPDAGTRVVASFPLGQN